MEQGKVDLFMSSMTDKFPSTHIMAIRSQLEKIDDSRFAGLQALDYKNPTTLLIVSLFVGGFGVDRFMLGQTGLGVAKLLTAGACGVWTIIDWFSVMNRTKEANYNLFMQNAQ